MQGLDGIPPVQEPLVQGIRILITTDEFCKVPMKKLASSLKGYKSDTKKANRKAMQIVLLASQYYKLGNLYFAAQKYRRNEFSSSNLIFCCYNLDIVDATSKAIALESVGKIKVPIGKFNKGQEMPHDLSRIFISGDKKVVAEKITGIMQTDTIPLDYIQQIEPKAKVSYETVRPSSPNHEKKSGCVALNSIRKRGLTEVYEEMAWSIPKPIESKCWCGMNKKDDETMLCVVCQVRSGHRSCLKDSKCLVCRSAKEDRLFLRIS